MRWLTILYYLSIAPPTPLGIDVGNEEDETIDDAKNEKLKGADCRKPKPGKTFQLIEECVIEDAAEHTNVTMVVLQERDFLDVPGFYCRMYRSAITEECWRG